MYHPNRIKFFWLYTLGAVLALNFVAGFNTDDSKLPALDTWGAVIAYGIAGMIWWVIWLPYLVFFIARMMRRYFYGI